MSRGGLSVSELSTAKYTPNIELMLNISVCPANGLVTSLHYQTIPFVYISP